MKPRVKSISLKKLKEIVRQMKAEKLKQVAVKPLIFVEETYDFKVHILAPCTPEQYSEYVLKITGVEYEQDDCSATCFSTVDDIILGFANWTGSDKDISNLVHELSHATAHSLAFRETAHSECTEEVYAYLIGSLMFRCLKKLRARRAREKAAFNGGKI